MSRSDRSEFLKAFGLASLLFASVFLLIWSFSQKSDWYQQTATDRSHSYTHQAETEIANRCAVAPKADQPKCVSEAKQAARTHQREEQDLAAQKITAWWTQVMGGAAIFGAVLSAIGVFLVFTTFRETRRSAETANKQFELARTAQLNDLRPHLFVDHFEFDPTHHRDRGFSLRLKLFLKNYGRIPARDISVRTHVYFSRDLTTLSPVVLTNAPIPIPYCAPGHERHVTGGIYLEPGEYDELAINLAEIVIRVRLAYRRSATKRYRERADYIYDHGSLETGVAYILSPTSRERRELYRGDLVTLMHDEELGDEEEEEGGERA